MGSAKPSLDISAVLDEIDSAEKLTIFLEEIVKGYDVGFGECGILFPKERESDANTVLFHSPMGEKEVEYVKFKELVEPFVEGSKHFNDIHSNLLEKALDAILRW